MSPCLRVSTCPAASSRPRLRVSAVRRGIRSRGGFTLLEVILSLTLATLVLMLIGIAIDAHITISERSRAKIEQAQLARSVFRMIGDDLRNAILYAPLDFSSIANLNLDADIGGGTPDPSGMGGDTSGMGGDQNAQGGNTPGGSTPGGNVPGSRPPTGQQPSGNQSSSGNPSSGGASNTSGGSNAGGTGGSTDAGSVLDEAAGPTEDPPGVYGSAYEINVDISRLPRVDEYDAMMQNGDGAIADIPSDVKTVAYYVAGDASGGTSPGGPLSSDAQGGLVRRAVDRAVTQYAYNAGSTAALDDSAAVLAPEVTDIAFEYFDGSAWSDTWDMVDKGAPPVAVRITIAIAAPKIESIFDRTVGALAGSASDDGETTEYTQVVYLPAAEGAASSGGSSTGSTAETGGAPSAEAAP